MRKQAQTAGISPWLWTCLPLSVLTQPPFCSFHPWLPCWALLSLRSQSIPSEFLTTLAHLVVVALPCSYTPSPRPPPCHGSEMGWCREAQLHGQTGTHTCAREALLSCTWVRLVLGRTVSFPEEPVHQVDLQKRKHVVPPWPPPDARMACPGSRALRA